MSDDRWEIDEAVRLADLLARMGAIDLAGPRAELVGMCREVLASFGEPAREAFRRTVVGRLLARLPTPAVSTAAEAGALVDRWFLVAGDGSDR